MFCSRFVLNLNSSYCKWTSCLCRQRSKTSSCKCVRCTTWNTMHALNVETRFVFCANHGAWSSGIAHLFCNLAPKFSCCVDTYFRPKTSHILQMPYNTWGGLGARGLDKSPTPNGRRERERGPRLRARVRGEGLDLPRTPWPVQRERERENIHLPPCA